MGIAIPRSSRRAGIDRVAAMALVASALLHGGLLYAAERWGNCLCSLGKVVCPKLCDERRLELQLSALPAPPPPPPATKPRPKPTVVETPRPKAHTAAPRRGRIVLPDEAFAKPPRRRAETTADLPALPREVVVKASEASAPVIATPTLFERLGSLSAGPPGDYGLGGTGRSTDPRASGTSPTATEVGLERRAPRPAAAPAPPPQPFAAPSPPPRPKGPSSPPRVLNWTDPPYPEAARRQGAEGVVTLRVLVSAAGRAEEVSVARSSGRSDFDDAAVAHVRQARFAPALRDGERVATTITFRVRFRLEES